MTCARGCCDSPAEHYRSIRFGADAMPNRKPQTVSELRQERQMAVDNAAYKRMRREGLRPATSVGAALIEAKATNPFEVESGRLYGPAKSKDRQIAEGLAISREIGLPTTSKGD